MKITSRSIIVPFTSGPRSVCALLHCLKKGWDPILMYVPHLLDKNTALELECVVSLSENLRDLSGNHLWSRSEVGKPYVWHRILGVVDQNVNPANKLGSVLQQCRAIAKHNGVSRILWNDLVQNVSPELFDEKDGVEIVWFTSPKDVFDTISSFIDFNRDEMEENLAFEPDYEPYDFIYTCTLAKKHFDKNSVLTDPPIAACCGECQSCRSWLEQYTEHYSMDPPCKKRKFDEQKN
jgi:hypothetical protein